MFFARSLKAQSHLMSLDGKVKHTRWMGYVTSIKGEESCARVLEENPERKRPLARPRHRWKNDV